MKDLGNHVVPRWASKWKQLGTQLGICEESMEILSCNFPYNCERCCSEMLAKWLDLNRDACWGDLIAAIDKLLHGT